MKIEVLKLDELKELGFVYQGKEYLDNEDFYRWWTLQKNDSEISITYEYTSKYKFTTGHIELNGEQLKGRDIQKKDVEFLIELM